MTDPLHQIPDDVAKELMSYLRNRAQPHNQIPEKVVDALTEFLNRRVPDSLIQDVSTCLRQFSQPPQRIPDDVFTERQFANPESPGPHAGSRRRSMTFIIAR
jgi:hypothetical protein